MSIPNVVFENEVISNFDEVLFESEIKEVEETLIVDSIANYEQEVTSINDTIIFNSEFSREIIFVLSLFEPSS